MLKQFLVSLLPGLCQAAAFRRLCVETPKTTDGIDGALAAAFRRLCVET